MKRQFANPDSNALDQGPIRFLADLHSQLLFVVAFSEARHCFFNRAEQGRAKAEKEKLLFIQSVELQSRRQSLGSAHRCDKKRTALLLCGTTPPRTGACLCFVVFRPSPPRPSCPPTVASPRPGTGSPRTGRTSSTCAPISFQFARSPS